MADFREFLFCAVVPEGPSKVRKRSRTLATPGIQLPALEILLHVFPGGMHQLGVDEDLLYLGLGAVAAHVLLSERLSEAGPTFRRWMMYWRTFSLRSASGPSPVPPINVSQNDPRSATGIDPLLLLRDAKKLYPYPRLR
jgi:hypothetical protein